MEALGIASVERNLGKLNENTTSGWEIVDGKLHKEFVFGNFIEAFANVYRGAAAAIRAQRGDDSTGTPAQASGNALDFPTVEDGAIGVDFIHQAVRSSREGGWVEMTYEGATP